MDFILELGNIGYRISRYTSRGIKILKDEGTGNNTADNRIRDTGIGDTNIKNAGIKGIRKPLSISSRESKTKHTNKEDVLV